MVKGCLALAAAGLAIPVTAFTIFAVAVHFKTQAKIRAAVEHRYGAQLAFVIERAALDNDICFNVALRDSTASVQRRIVMVYGDIDGGRWWFGREYASMEECKRHFDRG